MPNSAETTSPSPQVGSVAREPDSHQVETVRPVLMDSESAVRATVLAARRSGWQRRLWVGVLLVAGLSLVALVGFRLTAGEKRSSLRFLTESSRRGTLRATVTATGGLRALDQVEVGSELSGRIVRVHADFNDQVTEGQVLCELDSDQRKAAVKQARAQLGANRASLESALVARDEAVSQAERSQRLRQEALISTEQFEAEQAVYKRAVAGVAVARAQVDLARAALESAQTSLAKTQVHAPISGIVLSRTVEPGQAVAASLQAPVLFTLARDLRQMELRIQVDEADIGRVAERQPATFVVDAYPQRTFTARLTSIHNIATVQNNVVTYEAVLVVDNRDMALRPGMTATVTIVTAERPHALLVPNAALRFVPPSALPRGRSGGPPNLFGTARRSGAGKPSEPEQAGPRVWAKDGQAPPRAIAVETGLTDGQWTEVVQGALSEGQPLLVDAMLEGA